VSLQNWLENGWLVPHQSSKEEIRDLLGIATRDLKNTKINELSNDSRLNIAYNADLQSATAALAPSGYRPARDGNQHYRVIQSLEFTVGASAGTIRSFDAFRKKRNVSSYDKEGTVSDLEVTEMQAIAERLRLDVQTWLARRHPQLR